MSIRDVSIPLDPLGSVLFLASVLIAPVVLAAERGLVVTSSTALIVLSLATLGIAYHERKTQFSGQWAAVALCCIAFVILASNRLFNYF